MNTLITVAGQTCIALAGFSALAARVARRYDLKFRPGAPSGIAAYLAAVALDAVLVAGRGETLATIVLVACCAVSAITDVQNGHIFDALLLAAAFVSLADALLRGNLLEAGIGAAVSGTIVYLPHALTRGRAMGLGDVKFAILLGLGLGSADSIHALTFACIAGGTVAALLLAVRRCPRDRRIPFGPFLALGAAYALVWP